jgi:hypothetical protein
VVLRVVPTHPDYGSMPWAPPERIAELYARVARGDGDALAGRFIHVLHDFDGMRARADEIARDDLCSGELSPVAAPG